MTKWIRTKIAMPSNNERVLAKYEGVYDARIVTFWRDGRDRPHFGLPTEADGKGSQPATHWAKLMTPNGDVTVLPPAQAVELPPKPAGGRSELT